MPFSPRLIPVLARLLCGVALVSCAALGPPPPAAHAVDLDRLNRQIHQAHLRWEMVVEQYNDVRGQLRATQVRAADLTARLAPLQRLVDAREQRVGEVAARAYRTGRSAALTTLLGPQATGELGSRLVLVDRFVRDQQAVVTALAAVRDRYEATRTTLSGLGARQREQQVNLANRKRTVQAELRRLRAMRDRARGLGYRDPRPEWDGYVPRHSPGPAGVAVRFAYAQLGKAYQWGGEGPHGYDCSGLTTAAWGRAGVRLPHNAARQFHAVPLISRAELRPGDLVFYYRDIHHVGLFIGDGRIIHAPTFGQRIRIDPVGYAPIRGYGRPG